MYCERIYFDFDINLNPYVRVYYDHELENIAKNFGLDRSKFKTIPLKIGKITEDLYMESNGFNNVGTITEIYLEKFHIVSGVCLINCGHNKTHFADYLIKNPTIKAAVVRYKNKDNTDDLKLLFGYVDKQEAIDSFFLDRSLPVTCGSISSGFNCDI
ncbi:hypothetical protein M0R36_10785 [bacterium]|nr:hypothetical protein [bacterium]